MSDSATRRRGRGSVFFSTAVAALGGLLFGFDTAVISGTTEALQDVFGLDEFWLGFTVAVALIGTIVGAFSAAKPADLFGRRRVLFVLAVFYFVSALGSSLAQSWVPFLLYRFLGGLAVGGASVVAPMYIAEIAPAHLRGRLVAVNQLNVVSGILLAFFSNYLVAQVTTRCRMALDVRRRGVPRQPSSLYCCSSFHSARGGWSRPDVWKRVGLYSYGSAKKMSIGR